MEEKDAARVDAIARGFPPERFDTSAGVVPAEGLARAARIAICFRAKGRSPDWERLQDLAKAPTATFPGNLGAGHGARAPE